MLNEADLEISEGKWFISTLVENAADRKTPIARRVDTAATRDLVKRRKITELVRGWVIAVRRATFVRFVEGRKTPTSEGTRLPFHLRGKGRADPSVAPTFSLTLSFDDIRACVCVRDTCYGARLRTLHDASGVRQLDRVRKGEAPKRSGLWTRRNPFFPPFFLFIPSRRALIVAGITYTHCHLVRSTVEITIQRAATLSIPLGHYVPKRYPTEREKKMGHRITGWGPFT